MNFLNSRKPKSITQRKTQTGKSDYQRDKSRKAMPPGKRMSKTGRIFYESRANRSDLVGKKI